MTLWMPKKKPLYAPMLATFGGGSVRGFRPSGGPDLSLENFPVGYPGSGNYDSNYQNWFSAGFFGVDTGTNYTFFAGQDLSKVNFRYQSHDASQVSFFIGVVEETSTNNYRVQYMGRIDKSTQNDVGTSILVDMSTLNYSVGDPVIPSTGNYYMGWHSNNGSSGSVVNNGAGEGAGLLVDTPSVAASSSSKIHYVAQGGIPSADQTFTTTSNNTRGNMRFRFEV